MKGRKGVLVTVLTLVSLPVALALIEAAAFHAPNRASRTIVSSGETREYLLHVPQIYDRSRPAPLVISLHGAGLWGAAQMDISEFNRVADREGFIVVYPSGAGGRGPRIWRATGRDAGRDAGLTRDVRFIAELIDTLKATYNIDAARIYASGLSNGAGMSVALSCTLSDRIAAVGLVAAAHLQPWSACRDDRPVPMISFHGTADSATPYNGGTTWVGPRPFPDIETWTANWARRNRCGPDPVRAAAAADVTRIHYADCAADVVLYRIEGGGHTWPGGGPLPAWFLGPTNRAIDASNEMWAFFRDRPLKAR